MADDVAMKEVDSTGHTGKSTEQTALVGDEHRVSPKEAKRLRIGVLILSWFSVILLAGLGAGTLALGIRDDSSSAFAFALDAFLDVLSSLVVIWRFFSNGDTLYSNKKESMACMVLGGLFLVSSLSIGVRSGMAIKFAEHARVEDVIWYIYATNGTVCTLLMAAKLYFGWKLESKSILTDAVNSLIGGVLAFASLGGDSVIDTYPRAWLVDPVMGLVCALAMLAYGLWILVISIDEYKHISMALSKSPSTKNLAETSVDSPS